MPLKVLKREIETERRIGYRYVQMLARAEALVPGAGREAIEALLWDANAHIVRADVQNERVVLDGSLSCQAVYRQGDENTLRALVAKNTFSQAVELADAQEGMLSRVRLTVESVEARYENGHMVFTVGLGIGVWVLELKPVELISALEDASNVEARFAEASFYRLAAEAGETAVLTERVTLPQALDARTTLMEWGAVTMDACEKDLGGVRVKGRAVIEALIASGVEGHPAVAVKYPIEFSKLLELPEWLCDDVCVTPSIRNIRTQLEAGSGDEDGAMMIQADVHFAVDANLHEQTTYLEDAYATGGMRIELESRDFTACTGVACSASAETVRGTALLGEGESGVSSVIAARALPVIAETQTEGGRSRISGLIEAQVLYMASGSERAAAARTQIPFEIDVAQPLRDDSALSLRVSSAEANALMGDRLELKIGLNVNCETRTQTQFAAVAELEAGERAPGKPGYVICWPDADEDEWAIGRRYGVARQSVRAAAGEEGIRGGKPLVLRMP